MTLSSPTNCISPLFLFSTTFSPSVCLPPPDHRTKIFVLNWFICREGTRVPSACWTEHWLCPREGYSRWGLGQIVRITVLKDQQRNIVAGERWRTERVRVPNGPSASQRTVGTSERRVWVREVGDGRHIHFGRHCKTKAFEINLIHLI